MSEYRDLDVRNNRQVASYRIQVKVLKEYRTVVLREMLKRWLVDPDDFWKNDFEVNVLDKDGRIVEALVESHARDLLARKPHLARIDTPT